MRRVQGKCHCGNVAFELVWPDDGAAIPARACDCTFCMKHAGVWTSHPDATLRVSVQAEADLSRYEFGTKTAHFHVCRKCGVVPLVSCELDGRTYAVVNVHAFVDVDPACLRRAPATFEGEDLAARLARRARNWIRDVQFVRHPR
jgi:hypothetical protein